MDSDDGSVARGVEAGADGVLARIAAGDDGGDLREAPLGDEVAHPRDGCGGRDDDDAVDLLALLECCQRPDEQRPAHELREDLVDAAHALAAAGGDDDAVCGAGAVISHCAAWYGTGYPDARGAAPAVHSAHA